MKRNAPGRIPEPFVAYLVPLFVVVSLTALVDATVIVPMVEIDPSLTIDTVRSRTMESVRDILPPLAPPLLIVVLVFVQSYTIRRGLIGEPYGPETRAQVLKAPFRLGAFVAFGWVAALLIGAAIDLVTLTFPVAGEAAIYYGTSVIAICSTAVFGFLLTYATIQEINIRVFIPYVFPDGMVSRNSGMIPVGYTTRLILYWFGVSFFPLMVLGLGIYTRRYVPANEVRAYIFIAVFLPATLLLTYRVGTSTQRPIRDLVGATRLIADGEYRLPIRSNGNDEIGFLTDAVVDMARALEEKKQLSETFGRAVDPRVRDHLLAGNIALGGTRMTAAVMFCDIRGFTAFSEGTSEETVVTALNEHFFAMDRAIRAHDGMINKFLGDGFLAVFGVPLAISDPASAAFRSAIEIVAANRELNRRRVERGEHQFRLGIGIHLGTVIAGNVGSADRSEYTVIGDTVNLTSRIEGLTKRFDTEIVLTDTVASSISPQPPLRDLGEVAVRGRRQPIRVWTVAST